MNIVITNDDGWGADGIMLLTRLLKPFGKLYVVAPDGARSGMSNAVTPNRPITLRHLTEADGQNEAEKRLLKDAEVYVSSGTPSDCVKLAINVVFKGDDKQIDLLVSGINHGSNAAINLIYSGTIGACFVAAEHRIPAIGFSIYDMSQHPDFKQLERYLPDVVRHLLDEGIKPGLCYNVNAPAGEIKGIKWTRQCLSHWEKEMKASTLESGETVYSLSGYMVNDEPEATDTDEWALTHGYLSIQPCTVDMTAYGAL
ncbi:MAG: 5'/3'-nucleotidase SurE [Paludibacteraceae bacterium]|nr:5'/3'-nucleotidase SurE [Paludibacteraceae bacterium]